MGHQQAAAQPLEAIDPSPFSFEECGGLPGGRLGGIAWGPRAVRFGAWGVDDERWLARFREEYATRFLPALAAHVAWRSAGGEGGLGGKDGEIPRVLHHIWLGSEFPAKFVKLREGWRALHPEWEHVLWTDEAVATEHARAPFEGKEAMDAAPNYGEKSDILRLEILLRFGGVYVDVDFVAVRSLEPLLASLPAHAALAGLSNTGFVEVNNGLVAAPPGHAFIRTLLERILAAPPAGSEHSLLGVVAPANLTFARTGPGLWTKAAGEHVLAGPRGSKSTSGGPKSTHGAKSTPEAGLSTPRDTIIMLPCSFLYPIPNHAARHDIDTAARATQGPRRLHLEREEEEALRTRPEVFAVHLWSRSWQAGGVGGAPRAQASEGGATVGPASGADKPASEPVPVSADVGSSKNRKELKPQASEVGPASESKRPASGSDGPAPGSDKPTSGVDKPASESDRPASGLDKPASGSDKPATGVGGFLAGLAGGEVAQGDIVWMANLAARAMAAKRGV